MENKKTFLVTGAGGFVGGRVVETLFLSGYANVRAGIRCWSNAARVARFPIELVLCDIMDEELIDKMAEAGTKYMSYAIETASPRLQKLIRKNLRLERVFRAIEYTTRVGIITRGFFMIGFPTETEDEVLQTIEFAKNSSLCGATYFTVVYFPGTELYKLAQSLGYFQNEGYNVQRDYVQVGEGPYNFSLETLTELKKKAIKEFAFNKARIENAVKLLPSYFTQREIDGFFMAYVVSSKATLDEIEDEYVSRFLRRYFLVAERFSKASEFYV